MKLEGTAQLNGTPDARFGRLLDPETLQRCIKGCEALEELPDQDEDTRGYAAAVKVGIGAIKGRFKATVSLSDIDAPTSYAMSIAAKSPVGRLNGTAQIEFAPNDAGTALTWSADAKVSGVIAAVGQRLIGAAAQKFADDFFNRLQDVVGGPDSGQSMPTRFCCRLPRCRSVMRMISSRLGVAPPRPSASPSQSLAAARASSRCVAAQPGLTFFRLLSAVLANSSGGWLVD